MYHNPVMLNECLEGLNINPEGIYADVTFGGGGHSRAILERLTTGHLYAFDQDEDAAANAFDDERFTFIKTSSISRILSSSITADARSTASSPTWAFRRISSTPPRRVSRPASTVPSICA